MTLTKIYKKFFASKAQAGLSFECRLERHAQSMRTGAEVVEFVARNGKKIQPPQRPTHPLDARPRTETSRLPTNITSTTNKTDTFKIPVTVSFETTNATQYQHAPSHDYVASPRRGDDLLRVAQEDQWRLQAEVAKLTAEVVEQAQLDREQRNLIQALERALKQEKAVVSHLVSSSSASEQELKKQIVVLAGDLHVERQKADDLVALWNYTAKRFNDGARRVHKLTRSSVKGTEALPGPWRPRIDAAVAALREDANADVERGKKMGLLSGQKEDYKMDFRFSM